MKLCVEWEARQDNYKNFFILDSNEYIDEVKKLVKKGISIEKIVDFYVRGETLEDRDFESISGEEHLAALIRNKLNEEVIKNNEHFSKAALIYVTNIDEILGIPGVRYF